MRFPDCVLSGFLAAATRLYEQEREEREGSSALGMYVRRWNGVGKRRLGQEACLGLPTFPPSCHKAQPGEANAEEGEGRGFGHVRYKANVIQRSVEEK